MTRPTISIAAALAAVALLTGCAVTPEVQPTETAPPTAAVQPAPPLDAAELDVYGGVARIELAGNCTATLIDTGTDDGPAYVLTNGHCVGLDGEPANLTVVDQEAFGVARFFDVADGADVLEVDAARIEYATMRGTDVAVVRLDATLGDLRDAGAVPLPIVDAAPADGTAVVNIAAPVQDMEEPDWVLRKGECTVGATVNVVEHKWYWLDAQRNDCPGVLGGSSGSPLIADGQIVSIINTTNTGVPVERGDTCYLGKPCEAADATATFVPDTSYGVPVAGVGACFDGGVFSLGGSCPLQVSTLWDAVGGGIYGSDGVDGAGQLPDLQLRSDVDAEVVVAQNLPIGAGAACADPATYADAERVHLTAGAEEPGVVPIDLPREDGFVLACAAVPGQESLAARFVYAIDAVAPDFGPSATVILGPDGAWVEPIFDIPDIADIQWLYGPADAVDCADRDAYEPYFRIAAVIPTEDLPARVCMVGYDMAGNESPVTEQLIEP